MTQLNRQSKLMCALGFALFVGSLSAIYAKASERDALQQVQQTINLENQNWTIDNFDLAAQPDATGYLGVAKVHLEAQQATLYFDVVEFDGNTGLGEATVYKDGAKVNVGTIAPELMSDIVAQIEIYRSEKS